MIELNRALQQILQQKYAMTEALKKQGFKVTATDSLEKQINVINNYVAEAVDSSIIKRGETVNGVQGTMDESIRIDAPIKLDNASYGKQAADVARSYYLARVKGLGNFKYTQSDHIYNGTVTTNEGYCGIDCSGFVGLCLRGIDFDHSPYPAANGTPNVKWDQTNIVKLCENSQYLWADVYLDRQTSDHFKSLGVDGYYSVRTAAQQAQYFYCGRGTILYEYEEYKESPTSVPNDLQPGDLIFWSKSTASATQKARFKGISHVGIVAHDTEYFYQVTGYEDTKGNTVFLNKLQDKLNEITLFIRPNYTIINREPKTPIGINLFSEYHYESLDITEATQYLNDVEFTIQQEGGLSIEGKAYTSTTFYIQGNETETLILEPGNYTLSGIPSHSQAVDTQWGLSIKTKDGENVYDSETNNRVWCSGEPMTFTLTEEIEIYSYIYISSALTDTKEYIAKPTLIRNC